MRYGHFDTAHDEYVVERPDVPVSWTNYLGSKNLCTVLSHTGGGYSYYKSSQYGRITRFRTVMTGEIFNLLREHSILADLLADSAEADDAFAAGVNRGLRDECLTAELFKSMAKAWPRRSRSFSVSGRCSCSIRLR